MGVAWRLAQPADEEAVVGMCVALYEEDPGPEPVPPEHVRQTLATLRAQPSRGRAVVLDGGDGPVGYALLVAYWSNELGGEVCFLDEIYVLPAHRGRGHATALVEALAAGSPLWPGRPVACQLEVSPSNPRARRLYGRLGFLPLRNASLRRPLRAPRRES